MPGSSRSKAESLAIEAFAKRGNVVGVTRFDDAMNSDRVEVIIGECAIVSDVDNACAFFGNQTSEPREAAGAIADCRREAAESAVRNQATFDNAIDRSQVDVPASHRQNDILSMKVRDEAGKAGSQRNSPRAFHH